MRAGTPFTQLVEFPYGNPDGPVEWQLLDERGLLITQGQVVPADDAASIVIRVEGENLALDPGLIVDARELRWAYTVGSMIQSDVHRFRIEGFLPFGLSNEGVRRKLGVERHEIDDEGIDLVTAYGRFAATVGADEILAAQAAGGYTALTVGHAIEALAAIAIIPSLQVSLAQKESSGTNQFTRANINWDAIRAQLDDYVNAGYRIVNPIFDSTDGYTSLLVRVVRPDPIIGDLSGAEGGR